MTEERKQELTQLLEEAMESLEIQTHYGYPLLSSIKIYEYKRLLHESWTTFNPNHTWLLRQYKPEINNDIKSKLLDFLRSELEPFILQDRILPGYFFMLCITGHEDGVELNDLLEKLLKIAIFGEIKKAVTDFARSIANDASTSFESIVFLKSITIENDIQVFDGIRLVPVPVSSKLQRCLGSLTEISVSELYWSTMLVIDYSISPIFQKPDPEVIERYSHNETRTTVFNDKLPMENNGFRIKAKGEKAPEYTSTANTVFHQKFCQALSLACNSGVKPVKSWRFVGEEQFLNINPTNLHVSSTLNPAPFADHINVSIDQINKAKCLYMKLVNPNSNTPSNIGKKLHIAINRWIQSKTNRSDVDKIIDLGIALEALYLSEGTKEQLTLQFRLRASWYLGKDKEHRRKLIDEFKAIYDLRSQAVHSGKIPKTVKIRKGEDPTATSEFIAKAQDLCRDSILKILEDGEFPDWNDLILGEESM